MQAYHTQSCENIVKLVLGKQLKKGKKYFFEG